MPFRVLIADAHRKRRDRLEQMLTDSGYPPEMAGSMTASLESVHRQPPDVAFVSARLDRKAGFNVLRRIKQTAPETEVVVLVDAGCRSAMSYLSAGASDILPENSEKIYLLLVLDRAIGRIQSRRQRLSWGRAGVDTLFQERLGEALESERFIAVNQVLDNISLFIERISEEVEGGVKYFDQMPYLVSVHDRSMTIVSANAAHRKLLGNKIGKPSWEIYQEPWASPDECPVGVTLRSEQVMEVKAVITYRSGLRVPVIVHTAPIYNNDGEIELVLEVAAGVRDVRRLKTELQQTQQRYQQLFDAVPCYITVLNRNLRITTINQRFRDDFGEVTGFRFFEVFQHARAGNDPISQTLNDARPHESEMILTPADGDRFNSLVWTSPILTRTGKLIQVLVMFVDVTQIRQLRDNLSSLGLMIGSIAHGIKGILTGLSGGLYLINSGHSRNRPEKVEEGIDITRQMIERIERVVFDILYYAKKRTLNWKQVDALDFAGDVAATFEMRLREDNIQFLLDFDETCGTFEIDRTLLRSALVNILENAADACRADPSQKDHTITFRLYPENGFVQFDISDNGIGMDPDAQRQLFDLFYSTKGNRGTGLGMFITDKIIRQHGGRIDVESTPGRGSRFIVSLPNKLPDVVKQFRSGQIIDFEFAQQD